MKKIFYFILIGSISGVITFSALSLLNDKNSINIPENVIDDVIPVVPQQFKLTTSKYKLSNDLDFTIAAEKTVNAVVHIKSEYSQNYESDPLLDYFWGPNGSRGKSQISAGSGVLISSDGYIVTNNHVIDGSSKLVVILNDGRELNAEIIGADLNTDLALLKIKEMNLSFAKFGNSDEVKLGDWVLAVGNPFNLTSTVTAGIVSAKARNINILRRNSSEKNIFPLESFIQTDAAVNPGNSGGALVNPDGLLVGINTAIASRTGSYSGYSFAIPSNIALKVVNDLKNYGEVQRAFIGVIIQDVTQFVMDDLNLENTNGVLVSGLSNGGAAKEAGIEINDIILKVEQIKVNDVPELQEQIAKYKPGDIVKLIIQREGINKAVKIKLRNDKGTIEISKRKM